MASEQPADRPEDSLGRERGSSVSKEVSQVEEDSAFPAESEEWCHTGVEQQKTVPATKINFKHFEFGTEVGSTMPLDHCHDVIRSAKGHVPENAAVPVGGDPGVDSSGSLAAVDDRPPDFGPGLLDGANGAAEHVEGEVLLEERAEEGAIEQLLVDVCVHVVDCQVG